MLKTDKILNQTIIILILISLWIGGAMYSLMVELGAQKELNDYQNQLSNLTMDVVKYYEKVLDSVKVNTATHDNEVGSVPKLEDSIEKIASDFDVLLRSSIHLPLMNESMRFSLQTSINRAKDAILHLEVENYPTQIESYMMLQGEGLKSIMGEIDLVNQLTGHEQALRRGRIQRKLIQSAFLLVFMVSAAIIWLLVFRTLSPLKKLKQEFLKNTNGYQGNLLKIENNDEIGDLIKSYNELQGRASTIESLMNKLGEQDHFEDVLDFIFESFKPFIPYNRIGIAVLSSDQAQIRALSARSDRAVKLGKNYTANLSETSLRSIIESGEPRILNDLESYYKMKRHSESTGLMIEEGMFSSVTLPLIVRQECIGVVFFSSADKNTYTESHITFLRTIAGSLASAFDHSFLNDQLLVSTIQGFAQLVESKDSETGNHIDRMQRYSVMIAELLQMKNLYPSELNEQMIKEIRDFSPLHDIGKVAVPDHILLKPGKLTPDEFNVMKKHAVIGADILLNMNNQIRGQNRDFYKTGIDIVRYHHEKYDGSGYPDRLSGEKIPLSARIVALADVLDALTSKRPYKEAFSMDRARQIVNEGRGSHFDPVIVDVVIEYWDKFVNQAESFMNEESERTLSLIS